MANESPAEFRGRIRALEDDVAELKRHREGDVEAIQDVRGRLIVIETLELAARRSETKTRWVFGIVSPVVTAILVLIVTHLLK